MNKTGKVRENSDSLIGLLAAQCLDLEVLLSLARRENMAAEQKDFKAVLNIVTERARVGEKLETYQRQISELREFLGDPTEGYKTAPVAARIIELTEQTLAQDSKTKLLLAETREQTSIELKNLATGKRGVSLYMKEEQKGLSYNENI
jgi:anion-transporting  ArsA/GET3 family ATPase